MHENVEGPVLTERQVPKGNRVQIDVSARTFLLVNGALFAFSGYNIYHTLKALSKLSKEVPS